jgi:hypothetical protein
MIWYRPTDGAGDNDDNVKLNKSAGENNGYGVVDNVVRIHSFCTGTIPGYDDNDSYHTKRTVAPRKSDKTVNPAPRPHALPVIEMVALSYTTLLFIGVVRPTK